MGGLFSSLRLGLQNLTTFQTAISVVNDNISNANSPGFSRRRVFLQPGEPAIRNFGIIDIGSKIERIDSVRDRFLETRILNELQLGGYLGGLEPSLAQIESLFFASEDSGIGNQITRFFNSLSELSADPSSSGARSVVIAEGRELATVFASTSTSLQKLQADNRIQIRDSVEEINALVAQIAGLNGEVSFLERQGIDSGSLRDQRQLLMDRLAEEVGFSSHENESGTVNITTSSGRLLVFGSESFQLVSQDTSNGVVVSLSGTDVTSEITKGRLGGFLQVDNDIIPNHRAALNTLAEELATQINLIHQTGEGLDGSTGLDFFTFSTTDPAGSLAVAITDPLSIAAALPGNGPGDGTIAQQLADLRDTRLLALGDQTFNEYFSQIVFAAGLDARRASSDLTIQATIVAQLENQRASVSGVSLDEEAANLIQYQKLYQASTRFIQVVDELLDETLSLIR